jgi:hypothetical protein
MLFRVGSMLASLPRRFLFGVMKKSQCDERGGLFFSLDIVHYILLIRSLKIGLRLCSIKKIIISNVHFTTVLVR